MDNLNEEPIDSSSSQPDDPESEDIPLWLQGLEKHNLEDTEPVEMEDEADEGWIKELSSEDDYKRTTEDQKEDADRPLEEGLEDSPPASEIIDSSSDSESESDSDWMDVLAEIRPTAPTTEEDTSPEEERSNVNQEIGETFTELSEPEFAQPVDQAQGPEKEILPEDEDLPDWLTQMITEEPQETTEEAPSQETQEETQLTANKIEDSTQPIEVPSGESKKEDADSAEKPQEIDTEIIESTPLVSPPEVIPLETEEEKDKELDIAADFHTPTDENKAIVEVNGKEHEEVSEISYEPEVAESINSDMPAEKSDNLEIKGESEWKIFEETVQHDDDVALPETLTHARDLLYKDETREALSIFTDFVEKSSFLDQIYEWLKEAAFTNAKDDCDVWELLGDIALIQDQPAEAFEAYANAIRNLLTPNKFNEIN